MTESIGEASESEPPRFEAFVDGRVDEEKLAELLSFPEGSHLEFKAELLLSVLKSRVILRCFDLG